MQLTAALLHRLTLPTTRIDAVLDTDAYNEIDDQFALAYMLASDDLINTKAIYAAPFFNEKSTSSCDGMERSYREILNLLTLMGREDMKAVAFEGSRGFLPDEKTPLDSPAARDLITQAREYTPENPLYVIAIGAITNVASALLSAPDIADKIVVVWLGGHAAHWPHTREFNLCGDLAASRVLFDSGVALIQVPCMGVASAFAISGPELDTHLRGKNALCDYLRDITTQAGLGHNCPTWSRVLWDVVAVAVLAHPDALETQLAPRPRIAAEGLYAPDPTAPAMRMVTHVWRDGLLEDLVGKLEKI